MGAVLIEYYLNWIHRFLLIRMAKIGKSRLEALYLLVFVGFWYLLVKMPGLMAIGC